MFRKRRAAMNMTPLLDMLIILFFAQALQTRVGLDTVTDQYHTAESQLAETREVFRTLPQKIQDAEAKIATLEQQNQQIGAQLSTEQTQREQVQTELASVSKQLADFQLQEKLQGDLEASIDVARVLEMLQTPGQPTPNSEAQTERLITHLATQRTVSETLNQHLDIWFFIVSAQKIGDHWNTDLSFFINGKPCVEFGRHHDGAWAFEDENDASLLRQLNEELTHNAVVGDLGRDLIITFWFNEKGLPEHFRLKFRRVYTQLIQDLNRSYRLDVAEGGRGKNELRLFPASPDSSGLVPEDTASFPLLQGKR